MGDIDKMSSMKDHPFYFFKPYYLLVEQWESVSLFGVKAFKKASKVNKVKLGA